MKAGKKSLNKAGKEYKTFIVKRFRSQPSEWVPKKLPNAVWTGIGATGIVLVGIFVFKEPVTFWRLFFLIALIGSIVGLKAISR
jgi:quaternary ammonium compound-resistance protein SugE